MSERKFRLQVTEEELKNLILYHACKIMNSEKEITVKRSERMHDLTKRLHKTGPEIEGNPVPIEANQASVERPSDW